MYISLGTLSYRVQQDLFNKFYNYLLLTNFTNNSKRSWKTNKFQTYILNLAYSNIHKHLLFNPLIDGDQIQIIEFKRIISVMDICCTIFNSSTRIAKTCFLLDRHVNVSNFLLYLEWEGSC